MSANSAGLHCPPSLMTCSHLLMTSLSSVAAWAWPSSAGAQFDRCFHPWHAYPWDRCPRIRRLAAMLYQFEFFCAPPLVNLRTFACKSGKLVLRFLQQSPRRWSSSHQLRFLQTV